MTITPYEAQKMLESWLAGRRRDAQELLLLRKQARALGLRFRKCFEYTLTAKVGGKNIVRGTLEEVEAALLI